MAVWRRQVGAGAPQRAQHGQAARPLGCPVRGAPASAVCCIRVGPGIQEGSHRKHMAGPGCPVQRCLPLPPLLHHAGTALGQRVNAVHVAVPRRQQQRRQPAARACRAGVGACSAQRAHAAAAPSTAGFVQGREPVPSSSLHVCPRGQQRLQASEVRPTSRPRQGGDAIRAGCIWAGSRLQCRLQAAQVAGSSSTHQGRGLWAWRQGGSRLARPLLPLLLLLLVAPLLLVLLLPSLLLPLLIPILPALVLLLLARLPLGLGLQQLAGVHQQAGWQLLLDLRGWLQGLPML